MRRGFETDGNVGKLWELGLREAGVREIFRAGKETAWKERKRTNERDKKSRIFYFFGILHKANESGFLKHLRQSCEFKSVQNVRNVRLCLTCVLADAIVDFPLFVLLPDGLIRDEVLLSTFDKLIVVNPDSGDQHPLRSVMAGEVFDQVLNVDPEKLFHWCKNSFFFVSGVIDWVTDRSTLSSGQYLGRPRELLAQAAEWMDSPISSSCWGLPRNGLDVSEYFKVDWLFYLAYVRTSVLCLGSEIGRPCERNPFCPS